MVSIGGKGASLHGSQTVDIIKHFQTKTASNVIPGNFSFSKCTKYVWELNCSPNSLAAIEDVEDGRKGNGVEKENGAEGVS